jgi:hypothetical protein
MMTVRYSTTNNPGYLDGDMNERICIIKLLGINDDIQPARYQGMLEMWN